MSGVLNCDPVTSLQLNYNLGREQFDLCGLFFLETNNDYLMAHGGYDSGCVVHSLQKIGGCMELKLIIKDTNNLKNVLL